MTKLYQNFADRSDAIALRLTVIIALADAVAFACIWFGLYCLRDWMAEASILHNPINPINSYLFAFIVYLPYWFIVAWFHELYSHQGRLTSLNQLSNILKAFVGGLAGSLAIAYLFKQWDIGRFVLLLAAPLLCLWFFISRTAFRHWKQAQFRRGIGVTNVIVIGVGRTARRAFRRINSHPGGAYRFVGFVDHHARRKINGTLLGSPVLGQLKDLHQIVKDYDIHEVFLAAPMLSQEHILTLITRCEHLGVQFKIVGNLFEVISSQVQIDQIDEIPVIQLRNAALPPLHAALKRMLDFTVALLLLLLFALPMLIIALLIKIDSPGPAIFRQERIGLFGRPFRMYKFRTMTTSSLPYAMAPSDANDPRVTRVGYWLRRFSLDEFPQLLNVLFGDMSMVGPRPEMPFLVSKYTIWERRRLDVKPGLTGLWQIVGRKNLPLALNMEYDFYYIKNQSLLFDVIILIKTIPAVIFGKGAF
jgi:exopolysaccharide biosynthesis polyprenyl glycosylphosphotransferase